MIKNEVKLKEKSTKIQNLKLIIEQLQNQLEEQEELENIRSKFEFNGNTPTTPMMDDDFYSIDDPSFHTSSNLQTTLTSNGNANANGNGNKKLGKKRKRKKKKKRYLSDELSNSVQSLLQGNEIKTRERKNSLTIKDDDSDLIKRLKRKIGEDSNRTNRKRKKDTTSSSSSSALDKKKKKAKISTQNLMRNNTVQNLLNYSTPQVKRKRKSRVLESLKAKSRSPLRRTNTKDKKKSNDLNSILNFSTPTTQDRFDAIRKKRRLSRSNSFSASSSSSSILNGKFVRSKYGGAILRKTENSNKLW